MALIRDSGIVEGQRSDTASQPLQITTSKESGPRREQRLDAEDRILFCHPASNLEVSDWRGSMRLFSLNDRA